MAEPLSKVDSAVEGVNEDKVEPLQKIGSGPAAKKDRRQSSIVAGVASVKELWENKTPVQISAETQKTGWKINTSSSSVEDKEILTKPLVTPIVRAINLEFDLGSHVTARNRNGVTIKDAMDAIHKVNKKRADDEIDKLYLEGFEWMPAHHEYSDKEQEAKEADWQKLYVHLTATPTLTAVSGGKKKKGKKEE